MASGDGHDSLRKNRRCSLSKDADRSSKRHRHRRRHGSRKHGEESESYCETADCETAPVAPSPIPPRSSGTNRGVPDDDDVEEGEILEEDEAKLDAQFDANPAGTGVTGDRNVRSNNTNLVYPIQVLWNLFILRSLDSPWCCSVKKNPYILGISIYLSFLVYCIKGEFGFTSHHLCLLHLYIFSVLLII